MEPLITKLIFFVSVGILNTLFIVYLISFLWGGACGAPWIPSSKKVILKMLELSGVKSGDIVYDIGCGDGRLVFAAAERGAKATGFEVTPFFFIIAILKKYLFKKEGTILMKNFFHQNLKDADIVFCYLTDKTMVKLDEKLRKELKKGCLVVSHSFQLPGWDLKEEAMLYPQLKEHGKTYVYSA